MCSEQAYQSQLCGYISKEIMPGHSVGYCVGSTQRCTLHCRYNTTEV